MVQLVLVTFNADNSLPMIFSEKILSKYDLNILNIDNSLPFLIEKSSKIRQTNKQKLFYFREPMYYDRYNEKLKAIFSNLGVIKESVDGIQSYSDFHISDKWVQYKLLGESFFPLTTNQFDEIRSEKSNYLAKKKISGRSKDIILEIDESNLPSNIEDYIFQKKVEIKEEYRLYLCNNYIEPKVSLRASYKGEGVRVIGVCQISEELLSYAQLVINKLSKAGYLNTTHLYGLDFVLSKANNFHLLEINRSPQFSVSYQQTAINFFETLFI